MSQVPDGVMYAQVEQARAVQDYVPSLPCVRLVGVDTDSFLTEAFNSDAGCRTYFVDIAWDTLLATEGATAALRQAWPLFGGPQPPWEDWPSTLWVVLTFSRASDVTGTYAYEIFANANPTYLSLKSLSVVAGPSVLAASASTQVPTVQTSQNFKLYAYHVGQGMCALLKGQTDGFLLDVGAGTPVTRAAYRAHGTRFVNELMPATKGLDLQAVISHPDSDHWRLLDWDFSLCAQVKAVYLPSGTAALAFKSPRIKKRVFGLGSTTVTNGPGGATLFAAHRSQPKVSDRNGESLVVETHCGGRGLFPGDYVYDRMATDGNPAVNALATSPFDAVMVPHHGDTASASVRVSPRRPGSTPAFFSAGMHSGYGHPASASLKAHKKKRFNNIDNHTCTDIIEKRLR